MPGTTERIGHERHHEAFALSGLGVAPYDIGSYDEAIELSQEALGSAEADQVRARLAG